MAKRKADDTRRGYGIRLPDLPDNPTLSSAVEALVLGYAQIKSARIQLEDIAGRRLRKESDE